MKILGIGNNYVTDLKYIKEKKVKKLFFLNLNLV